MKKSILFLLFTICIGCVTTPKVYERASIWEKEIQALEARDKVEVDPENAVLFTGSSSVRLWNNIISDMAPYKVIQRGFGGANFTDLIYFTERIVYPHQFKAIVIYVANDITGGANDKTPREFLDSFIMEEKLIRKKYRNQPIYFIGITPTKRRWSVWALQKQANSLVAAYCSSKSNLFFIDTEKYYLNDNKEPVETYFVSDQLHQNQKGYDVWATIIKQKLNETLK